MRSVVERLRECGGDAVKLAEWERVIDQFAGDPGGLTRHGVEEMFALGARFRERYQFDDQTAEVKVRSSFKSRAAASAEAFVRGYCSVVIMTNDDYHSSDEDDDDDVDDFLEFDERDPDASTCTTASEIDEQQDADIVPSFLQNALGSSCDLTASLPLPPSSPGSSLSSSSDVEDDSSVSVSSLPSSVVYTPSSSSLPPSIESDDAPVLTAVDGSVHKPFTSTVHTEQQSQSLSLTKCQAQPQLSPAPPRVQILDQGDDASLRFFDYHQGYAEFARNHKVQQRSRLAAKTPSGPCTAHGDLAQRVSAAFGVKESDCLAPEHIRIIAEAAAFDYAHGRTNSILTSVLTPRDIRFLEGFEKRYRPFFKGHERFGAVTAPLVEDLVGSLMAVVNNYNAGQRHVAADLRFAHAETIVPFLLLLGVTSNNMQSWTARNRFTDLSAMSPFAANFAIELFAPLPGGASNAFRVKFRLHERYVSFVPALGPDGCDENGFIKLDTLLAFFREVLDAGSQDMSCMLLTL